MTHKIDLDALSVILNGSDEYMPYKLGINNSVDTFLKIRETLTRVGRIQEVENKNSILYQVCHIVQDEKSLEYYLVHFKHLYLLSGKNNKTEFNEQDADQLTYIAHLLKKWEFCTVYEPLVNINPRCNITIIPFVRKKDVILRRKFNIRKDVKENKSEQDFNEDAVNGNV